MSDAVNKPAHYNQGSIECIDAMQIVLTPEEYRGFLKGNAIKYLWREENKGGIEDLKKAKWYLDRLVDSLDEYEQQKAADLQSLKDHPFGKLKTASLNSDTIPEGYRKLNDSSEEPRQLGDLRWSVAEKRYIEISVDEIGYANRDNWAACRKVEPAIKQALTTDPPDGCRPNDNVALAMQMATSRFGRKVGVFNAANFSNAIRQLAGVECTLDGHVVATILGGRSDVEVLKGGSHYRYLFYESISSSKERVEPPKQQTTPKPPDGWRFLEEGEVIRKGDKPIFPGGEIKELKPAAIGKKHERPCRAYCHYIRRNRFEVGEKVVYIQDESVWNYISEINDGPNYPKSAHVASGSTSLRVCVTRLAPYIEDAK